MAKHTCDGCGKLRTDVRSVGRDYNGDPDAPDLCFICRKEGERGKVWNTKVEAYVDATLEDDDLKLKER
jgi:hypothetical protein